MALAPPLILLFTFSLLCITSSSQSTNSDICNGIQITYVFVSSTIIPPTLVPADPENQPYSFRSTLTVINNDREELKSWRVFVVFEHGELLTSASNAILADGRSLPANVTNGTVFAGYPVTDLKSAIETAGDFNQMQARVELVGTLFGLGPPNISLPSNLTLVNDGFSCSAPNSQGNQTRVCCAKDPNARTNITTEEEFQPLQDGDLTIIYDVLRAYEGYYWAQVTISNDNPISRLDNWQLSWEWMRGEFIFAMRGAYPSVVDASDCIFGPQGEFYKGIDLSTALSCEKRPIIIDLPLEKTNDTNLGMVPNCCRNGTLLPISMDSSKSKSSFQMQVYKMPPDLNRSVLIPPQNWNINGSLSPQYVCSPPVRVSPTLFPDPSGLPAHSAAIASWQVVCNITRTPSQIIKPKCCVSFSAFYNDSAIPCNTCACGCTPNPSNVCSADEPPLLVPPEALLVPFDNRTDMALERLRDRARPNPLPCGDNCGVSINWHVLTDYSDGWTARITLFNWDGTSIADWFAALEFNKAVPGFDRVYSFDGKSLPGSNDTIFLQGLEGQNFLVAEKQGKNPRKDPPVPGTQQSVLLFRKKNTPDINVARGDGFPTKVFFNGEECSLPSTIPSAAHRLATALKAFSILLTSLAFIVCS